MRKKHFRCCCGIALKYDTEWDVFSFVTGDGRVGVAFLLRVAANGVPWFKCLWNRLVFVYDAYVTSTCVFLQRPRDLHTRNVHMHYGRNRFEKFWIKNSNRRKTRNPLSYNMHQMHSKKLFNFYFAVQNVDSFRLTPNDVINKGIRKSGASHLDVHVLKLSLFRTVRRKLKVQIYCHELNCITLRQEVCLFICFIMLICPLPSFRFK